MSDGTSRYLAKAAECERRAAHANSAEIQATFSDLADQWREIAREVEYLARLQRGLRMTATSIEVGEIRGHLVTN